jgi:hypothetical protein
MAKVLVNQVLLENPQKITQEMATSRLFFLPTKLSIPETASK